MAWIEASHQRRLEVNVPKEEVAQFLADPSRLIHCMVDLERGEEVDEQTWRWIREEIGARNITFQGDYTVRYEREGDTVRWESIGEGNMRTKGVAHVRELGPERSEVDYEETIASDLPIPKLAAKVFRPIVAREVKKGIDSFLEQVESYLNAGRHLSEDGS